MPIPSPFKDVDREVVKGESVGFKDRSSTYEPNELYPPYPNTWYPVVQSKDLKPGQVMPLYVFEKDLVLFRTQSGKVCAMDAYCPHQGAHLGIGGSVFGESINCPFHSWKFSSDGVCTSVPGLEKPPNAKIKTWNCIERNHWIFIWFHINSDEPTWTPPKLKQYENVEFSIQNELYVSCHILDSYGNGFDIAHLDELHSISGLIANEKILTRSFAYNLMKKIFYLNSRVVSNEDLVKEQDSQHYMIKNIITATPMLFGRPLTFFQILGTTTYVPTVVYTTWTIKGLNISYYGIYAMTPISPMRWHAINCFYYDKWNMLAKLLTKMSADFNIQNTIPEHIILRNKRFMRRPYLTKLDKLQNKFWRWFIDNFYDKQSL